MKNWRSSDTATLGIAVKLHTTASLQNVTTSHTIHVYMGERKREQYKHKEKR